jgi:hypothetical protein
MSSDPKKVPTIEELLRLKRLERPPETFWPQFEQDLRAKQLAAIVVRRPWWASCTRLLSSISRHQLPIAAAFFFGASAFVFHQYHDAFGVKAHAAISVPDGASVAAPSMTVAEETPATPAVRSVPSEGTLTRSLATGSETATAIAVDAAGPSPSAGRFLALGSTARTDTPSARSIAANLAAAQAEEPEIMRNLLGFSGVVDERLVPEQATVTEPLARMASPSDVRRSRLLAGVFPVATYARGDSAPPSADRLVRKLDDDRLYDSVSRYDLGGRQFAVSIKF